MLKHPGAVLLLAFLFGCSSGSSTGSGGGAAGGAGGSGGGTSVGGGVGGGSAGGGAGGGTVDAGSPVVRVAVAEPIFMVRANKEVWSYAMPTAVLEYDGDPLREFETFGSSLIAIRSDGGVFTGNGDPSMLADATKVGVGVFHGCAIVAGGAVKCFGGFNLMGELGNGSMTASMTPVDVTGLTNAASLALGRDTSCALKTDGTVACWGETPGDGTSQSSTPVVATGLAGVTALGGGYGFRCAVMGSETRCWGDPFRFPAEPDGGSGATPQPQAALSGAVEVRGGRDHACARFGDGTVRCWGMHGVTYSYELGVATPQSTYVPVAVPGITDAIQLAVGKDSSCVLRTNGKVTCWGAGISTASAILKDLPPLP